MALVLRQLNPIHKKEAIKFVFFLSFLVLLHQGHKHDFIIKSMNKKLKTLLPDNIKTGVAIQGKQYLF